MNSNIVMIKMPHLRWGRVREIDVPFLFKIMTLELICEYLKIPVEDLFDESTIKSEKMPVAIVWCGYLAACKDNYMKPRYTEKDAMVWDEYMKKSSRDEIMKGMTDLFGRLSKTGEAADSSGVKKK